ncbi:MAG: MCE family protein [Neisseriaceae bacterium]|nr:MCE family protein [Neisseriaceae bacterium]
MTDDTQQMPTAKKRYTKAVATVWLVPLAALAAGVWLLASTMRERGPEITLALPDADGIQAGSTVIKLLNVDVGRVVKVSLNDTHNGVILKARMDKSAAKLLTDETQFWLVKPRIDRRGVTGLGTLVSGYYIEMSPGKKGNAKRDFTVIDAMPSGLSTTGGKHFQLVGEPDGALLSVGSSVLYRNIEVGEVENAHFNPQENTVSYRIFIKHPNDVLVGENTQFWSASGLNVDFSGGMLNVAAPPVGAILSGGAIAFDNPQVIGKGAEVSENKEFVLHKNANAIEHKTPENALKLVAFFDQSVASLQKGSPVVYKGITVGYVENPQFFHSGDKSKLFDNKNIPVLFYLSPELFGQNIDINEWKQSIEKSLDKGLSASIGSNNLLLGSGQIELLDSIQEKPLKPVNKYQDFLVIGTQKGGLDSMTQQLNALLEKINHLPLEKTVAELNQTIANLDKLLSNKDTQSLPQDIRNTLQELQKTLNGISPDAPVYRDIQQTLNKINHTLDKAEPVLRRLDEKPNALIFNDNRPDPLPKGKQ